MAQLGSGHEGKSITIARILKAAKKEGINKKDALRLIRELERIGDIYSPTPSTLKISALDDNAQSSIAASLSKREIRKIYQICHEIKTPTTNIAGFSQLLLSGEVGKLSMEQKGHISTILEEARRVMAAVGKLQDLMR